MSEPWPRFTPTMARLKSDYMEMREEHFGFSDLYAEEWDRALAEHDHHVAERAYKAAEDAAAEALTKWWLTDTSPDEDTSSVMDVRNAIRGLYRAAKGEQK
jgi:hypothetical protein